VSEEAAPKAIRLGAWQFLATISAQLNRGQEREQSAGRQCIEFYPFGIHQHTEIFVGVKKTGKGRRKLGRKKRRMRSRIRHRKG
jgi:hypothetical protein